MFETKCLSKYASKEVYGISEERLDQFRNKSPKEEEKTRLIIYRNHSDITFPDFDPNVNFYQIQKQMTELKVKLTFYTFSFHSRTEFDTKSRSGTVLFFQKIRTSIPYKNGRQKLNQTSKRSFLAFY